MTAKQIERQAAIEDLRGLLRTGDTVHCVLRNVSRSGMSRVIDLFVIRKGDRVNIGHTASVALDSGWDRKRQGIRVGGCGMDMGFATVYNLAWVIFHDTRRYKRWAAKQSERQPRDAGYMLTHRWV